MVQGDIRKEEMEGVASDEGIGRRLPPWMLGVPADDHVRRSNDVDGNKKHPEEEHGSQASLTIATNSIRHPRKSALLQRKGILTEDSQAPECESKKRKARKRKSGQEVQDADAPDAVPKKISNRLGRKSRNSALPNGNRPDDSGFGSEIQAQPTGDDNMELTVEDLMVIAKEYVEADEDRASKLKFHGERGSSSPNQRTSSTGNQSEGYINSPNTDSKQRLLNCKTLVPHNSTAIADGEKVDIDVRRTGDPTKDMLDLFLGPLLKKSPENEKSESFSVDVQFSHALKSQSRMHNDNVELVSVMKKKSSLKDKVAIFLG